MKPYYEDGSVTIYHGRCQDLLDTIGPVDVALTDPPYGIDGGSGSGVSARRARGDYASDFPDDRAYIANRVVPIICLLCRIAPCVVVTPGNRNLDLYPRAQSFGAFYQPAAVGLQTFGNLDAQPILYYGKNSRPNMGTPCSYVLTEAPEANGHPCPKPLGAWKRLLSNVSLSGQTILDPFMGSGTTLVAAKYSDRKAIGIEIEERYCEIAAKRCAQEVLDFAGGRP
jgi:DNA modification methylase